MNRLNLILQNKSIEEICPYRTPSGKKLNKKKRKIIATGGMVRADLFYWDCLDLTQAHLDK